MVPLAFSLLDRSSGPFSFCGKKRMGGWGLFPLGGEKSAAFGRRKRFGRACGAEYSALPCAALGRCGFAAEKRMGGWGLFPLGGVKSAAFGRRKRFGPACGAECSALPCAALSGAASPPKRDGGAGSTPPGGRKKRGLWPHKKVRPRLRRGMISASMRCFKRCGFAAMYSGRFAAKKRCGFRRHIERYFHRKPPFFRKIIGKSAKDKNCFDFPHPLC